MTQLPNDNPWDDAERDDAWDQPRRRSFHDVLRRAAKALWFLGTVEAVVFGYLTLSMLAIAALPEAELRQRIAEMQETSTMDPAMVEAAMQFKSMAMPFSAALALFGFIPGVAYIVLGFYVRRGRATAVNFSLLMIVTQGIVVGVLLMAGVLASIQQMSPGVLTAYVLLLGTPMALLVFAGLSLMRSRALLAEGAQDPEGGDRDDLEPWDRQW